MHDADTIAAVATAAGRAGIGVVRVSGPGVRTIMNGVIGRILPARSATLANFNDAQERVLDRGVALFFPEPGSYTGEDVLELQGHGGPAVLRMILRRCIELGARPARPGEFTQRAFLNGKLDLAQAESVADLIDASSEAAARGAMRSLAGEFSDRINSVVRTLIDLRVRIEGSFDFPEEDMDVVLRRDAVKRLEEMRMQLSDIRQVAEQGRLLREGARVVLIGQPNVGKSSLMNRLAHEEVAIVTEIPGTTRDPLRHELVIEGVPMHVIDTAGLREPGDPVEKLGIDRAWKEVRLADVAVLVVDATSGISAAEREILGLLPEGLTKIIVFNKIDLTGEVQSVLETDAKLSIRASAKTGAGLDLLRAALLHAAGWQPSGEIGFIARERHLHALGQADMALEAAVAAVGSSEVLAEELRLAQRALGAITGEFSPDDLLGEIFSRFCIGK